MVFEGTVKRMGKFIKSNHHILYSVTHKLLCDIVNLPETSDHSRDTMEALKIYKITNSLSTTIFLGLGINTNNDRIRQYKRRSWGGRGLQSGLQGGVQQLWRG